MSQSRSNYHTKQKELIQTFFKEQPGIHFTIAGVYKALQEKNRTIGMTTLYRQIEALVKEGVLHQYPSIPGEAACYEYLCEHQQVFVHFRCENCGKLYHLPCEDIKEIRNRLQENHRCQINLTKTVFVGKCQQCLEREIQ
ncbi:MULTISPECIES: Fur family transcriptional regulator [Terrabacteria group]|uniref:Fur family transcriptional regulator n=1 Tax=Bacillati TaxID=1783272 RepID=UPI001939C8CE|nr:MULTISPECIES: transcriptional repressor [Terrabacteria group]MBW9213001.1 transcriptional repressor [Trueperella sp. zg.1013]QRG87043.1 transcriptional repressor [Bulleidia sp. zg-1006]